MRVPHKVHAQVHALHASGNIPGASFYFSSQTPFTPSEGRAGHMADKVGVNDFLTQLNIEMLMIKFD